MGSVNKTITLVLALMLVASLIAIQSSTVKAQTSNGTSPPATQWQKLYGSGLTIQVSNLIETSDDGYAFLDCGYLSLPGHFIPSTLYKLDSLGNMQWNKTFNLLSASSLIQTSDGGYEISGQTACDITYQFTPTLIKLDSKGDIQWSENTTTVLNLAIISSNIQTSDKGFAYFKSANVDIFPSLTSFPTLVKTNPNNGTQWIENFIYSGLADYYNGTITFDFKIFSITESSDGALACLGMANPFLQGNGYFIYLMKTEPFLPLPSQNPLPTPLPSPVSNPNMITVNVQIVVLALIVVVVLSMGLMLFRRQRKRVP